MRPGEIIETYYCEVYGVQQQKKDKHRPNQKILNILTFCDLTESQSKKQKLFNISRWAFHHRCSISINLFLSIGFVKKVIIRQGNKMNS